MSMRHLDLFSGIGGFALAVEAVWPDVEHVFCEIDPFCQAVLKKHWPTSKIYGDIRSLTNTQSEELGGLPQQQWASNPEDRTCDLLTGGFPCQPFSQAGRRKGTADDRHLWPEMRRVIQEFFPRFVVAENVRGLLSINGGMVFEQVCLDLEALGYEVQPFVIPACAVNAPHRRDRVWIVAHAASAGSERGDMQDGERPESFIKRNEARSQDERCAWDEPWPQAATRLCSLDDGLRSDVVRHRGWRNASLKAAGNAIVPQVAEHIFQAISLTLSPPQQTGE